MLILPQDSLPETVDWEAAARKPHRFNWDMLSSHPQCTSEVVLRYPHLPWRLLMIFSREMPDVAHHMYHKMPLMYHGARLSWQIVSQIVPYDLTFLTLYKPCLDWHILSRRSNIDWELVIQTKNTLPWVFSACSKNKSLTLDIIHRIPHVGWNEKRLSHQFKIRKDYLSKFLPAVITIQRHWLKAYYDPYHASGVCRRRISRSLSEDLVLLRNGAYCT